MIDGGKRLLAADGRNPGLHRVPVFGLQTIQLRIFIANVQAPRTADRCYTRCMNRRRQPSRLPSLNGAARQAPPVGAV
jgi:hypothetical protein